MKKLVEDEQGNAMNLLGTDQMARIIQERSDDMEIAEQEKL